MAYVPAGHYAPDFWTIGSCDGWHTDRPWVATNASTNTAYVANLALYVPFAIATSITVMSWYCQNGTLTTAHNIDFGIYNEDFTKVQSMGSTTGVTTASDTVNYDWTDLTLAPGAYYMAIGGDSTRNFLCGAEASNLHESIGLMEQTGLTGATLPSPAVPVVYKRAFVVVFGMNCRSINI